MFDSINKIKISEKSTYLVRQLKGQTGLTPNILARFAFCHSLNIPGIPTSEEYDSDGMEFNRYTITGQHDLIMMTLLAQRLEDDGLGEKDANEQFRLHICRGIMEIWPRVYSLLDLQNLLQLEVIS